MLNPAYASLAEHYGTAIVPARVKRPRDKPVVEGSVRFVANQVAAVLRDRRFVGLAELNEAIVDVVEQINARPFQKREDSRQIVFLRDEQPLLHPLPPARFELADLRKAKAGPNYHIQVDRNFYSVPSALIGHSLDVRVTSGTVEVFAGAERVASHRRLHGVRGRYSTVPEHMPAGHRHRRASLTDVVPRASSLPDDDLVLGHGHGGGRGQGKNREKKERKYGFHGWPGVGSKEHCQRSSKKPSTGGRPRVCHRNSFSYILNRPRTSKARKQ